MIIFKSNIKRFFKDKGNFIFMFIFPIVFITLSMGLSMGGSKVTVGIVDYDKTKLTQYLIDGVKQNNTVRFIDEKNIKKELSQSSADYIMLIPKGFTDNIINNRRAEVKGYSIKESNVALPTKYAVNDFLLAAKNIGALSNGNSDKFYQGIQIYQNGSFKAVFSNVKTHNNNKGGKTLTALGFLIMSMLFTGNNSAQLILDDKRNKTFYRIFAGPITAKNYMIQNIASFLAVMVIQLVVIFDIMKTVFHAEFGSSIINVFILYIIFAMFCVSLGVAIMSISKNSRQAGSINTFITVPMCMIGGCFWPRDLMPDILNKISNFLPTTWILRASDKIVSGGTLGSAGVEIGVLLLFTLVFVLLGSWKKADITK